MKNFFTMIRRFFSKNIAESSSIESSDKRQCFPFPLKAEKVVIIIPTYNEEDTIVNTISLLEQEIQRIKHYDISILVFDSHSEDDTIPQIHELTKKYANINLLTEPMKTGLGSAYRQAMIYALQELKADIIFEFDSDGSHQPKYIKPMLDKITSGYDVVVGSRYVVGGTIPKDWALHRRLLSKVGNLMSQLILSPQYKDYTSGFRCARSTYLRQINLQQLFSNNYAYKIDLFWRLHELGAKIIELPIEFIDRKTGISKFPRNNVLESLYVIIRLRLLTWLQSIKRFLNSNGK